MKYFLIFILTADLVFAQTDLTATPHQWVIQEAWEYLKIQKPNINWNATDMASHIGDYNGGSDEYPWTVGTITAGA